MHPIRGDRSREVAHAAWEANEYPIGQNETVHVVSDLGAVESMRTVRQFACACGCLKPVAGFCGECSSTACATCFGFCMGGDCNKPLCRRHSRLVAGPDGTMLRFCSICYGKSTRRRIFSIAMRLLLSPFFAFENENGQKK